MTAEGDNVMRVNKLLWPTDLSENAGRALPQVQSLTEKYGCEVHVLYVIQELAKHEPWYGEFDQEHLEKISIWQNEQAEKHLNQICEKYLHSCPRYIRHVSSGDPATEILNLIEGEKIDMVVMATCGGSGTFPFGSVADKVVKHSPVAVVTIPVCPVKENEAN
jgi:nucleotide-binding universal stress UspA family protein